MLTVKSAEDGAFDVRYLPSARLQVGLSAGTAYSYGFEPQTTSISLAATSEATVQLELQRAIRTCVMHVVSQNGDAVAGAQVFALMPARPFPALLGSSDASGRIALPDAIRLGTGIYVVRVGRPWLHTVRPECDREFKATVPEPHGIVTEFQFPVGDPEKRVIAWGLIDDSGGETPLLFHMMQNGILPGQATQVRVPEIPPGTYSIWVMTSRGTRAIARRAWLPSREAVVVTAD